MIGGLRVLAIVPARGGSKGVPRKNVRVVQGEPLIGWTIRAARASRHIDRLIVSSDDEEICRVAERYAPDIALRRPPELATDEAGSQDVVLHALDALPGFDLAVLLQPTSPLRQVDDIDACLSTLIRHHADSCISVSEASESPYWMYRLDEAGHMTPVLDAGERPTRRQDQPKVYLPNGAVYAFSVGWFRQARCFVDERTLAYVMPASRSIDIDTEMDMLVFEHLVKKENHG